MRTESKVYVAGTFDLFHRGHMRLIDAALCEAMDLADAGVPVTLTVCVMEDGAAQASRARRVGAFADRLRHVQEHVARRIHSSRRLSASCAAMRIEFVPMPDPTWTDGELQDDDVIVCSAETRPRVMAMLEGRPDRGRFISVVTVPMFCDGFGPVHATDILRGRCAGIEDASLEGRLYDAALKERLYRGD